MAGNENGGELLQDAVCRTLAIEMLDGKPYPSTIGEITVTKLSGDDFAECSVPKKIGAELLARFQAAEKLTCNLIIK